jgi:hypothetical protein
VKNKVTDRGTNHLISLCRSGLLNICLVLEAAAKFGLRADNIKIIYVQFKVQLEVLFNVFFILLYA